MSASSKAQVGADTTMNSVTGTTRRAPERRRQSLNHSPEKYQDPDSFGIRGVKNTFHLDPDR